MQRINTLKFRTHMVPFTEYLVTPTLPQTWLVINNSDCLLPWNRFLAPTNCMLAVGSYSVLSHDHSHHNNSKQSHYMYFVYVHIHVYPLSTQTHTCTNINIDMHLWIQNDIHCMGIWSLKMHCGDFVTTVKEIKLLKILFI